MELGRKDCEEGIEGAATAGKALLKEGGRGKEMTGKCMPLV